MCVSFLQSERAAQQWAAWEKQQKELEKNEDIIKRLAGGAQSGRASQVLSADLTPGQQHMRT